MYRQVSLLIVLLFFLSGSHSYSQFLNLKFDHITSEDGLPHSTIHGITKDKYGFMWFGTWSGLARYDGYKFRIYRYDAQDPKSIINNRIHNILTDADGMIWALTFDENFLCKYNYDTDNFERIPREKVPDELWQRIIRRNHRLSVNYTYKQHQWYLDSYTNAVVETHLPTGLRKQYGTDPINMWSINDNYVSDIYLDNQRILWLGTYSNGINKTYLEATPFHYLHHDPHNRNSIIDNTIRSICEDLEGNLWIATRSKGITVVPKNGQYRHFQHDETDINSLRSNYIKKIFCDSKGYIWIGGQRGLDRYDPQIKKITRIEHPSLSNTTVFGIMEDHQHNIWLATWNGIFKYVRTTATLIHFDPAKTLPQEHVWTIFQDSKHQIWAGTEGSGIVVLKEQSNGDLSRVMHLKHDSSAINTLSDNRIYSIYEDQERNVWIGTGNGLDRYDPQTKSIKHFSGPSHMLPKGTIAGITEDRGGFLWVSHKQGISKINKKTFSIRTFSQQDGLQSNEFAEGAVYKSPFSDLLFFGGNKGVNSFHPDSIKTDTIPPRVVFTEIQILNEPVEVNGTVNGRVLLHKPLYLTTALDLTHDDKSIAIEFAALHYTNPAGNKYAYMLEGFDKDWIYTDATKRSATYSNLAPGKYTFKVRASNSDGIWNPEPTVLRLSVAPPIWASTAAYIFYTLLCLSLLYAYYYYIVRYARLKSKLTYEAILHEKERELHESKVQFFTNISHEIKTPLTLILTPIQQLLQLCKDNLTIQSQLKTMENNGNRLLKIVNQLLDIRRFETGHEHLTLEHLDLIVFVHRIVDSFQQAAQSKDIVLQLETSLASYPIDFDPDKMEKVLYNLLSNAFKFTHEGGNITVSVYTSTDMGAEHITIDVIDNGIGILQEDISRIFQPFQQGKSTVSGGSGLGLTYSKSLIELHGGTLYATSTRVADDQNRTVFRLTLPIEKNNGFEQSKQIYLESSRQTTIHPSIKAQQQEIDIPVAVLPRKCTLLIVEDNSEMRGYLSDFFSGTYHILEAADGIEGIAIARKHLPDLIISDVMMPNMDGITFCAQVKSDLLLCHIPVILLTAKSLVEYEIEGLEMGADDYIVKPFHLPSLALKVRNQLFSYFRLQEKFKQKVSLEPAEINLTSPDESLLQKVLSYVEEHIADSDLKIDAVCNSVGLSRAQLYRKMKALTGYSMADLIKEIRLKRAQQLLREKKFHVSEIAYMVGFTDSDYFRKCFKAKFGDSPSAYANSYSDKGSTPL
ncbi:response regulator [Sphingobacterium olei]|uniref:histidine kinase n=1 Tax=Sphingobacterium olei TaxID=2571155 RepID=A0A4U0P0A6_9SPHI|nr:hybrid sensor histidine kinase/response regulator transcription factor [Sphingobacterium olei]TJZ60533.1 response regulator [Sphingobacterium olei]